jgi:DNA primase
MPKSSFVDFKAVKAAITMEQVLEHYGFLQKFKKKGDSLSGPCPIHKGENPTQFRVSVSKNIWNCFSECKHGGNVLDFIAEMENSSIHAAALKAIEWFQLEPNAMSANSAESKEAETLPAEAEPKPDRKPKKAEPRSEEPTDPNKPLKFRLEKLERAHPYLVERGLTTETLVDFGAGFCAKGMMSGRIAIPIHNRDGEVVAYAGRLTNGEPSDENPKYKLPPGFRKSLELFNIDRASKESPEKAWVIVEGFFDCMKLHQLGHRKTVALMGSSMSPAQEELIREHTSSNSRIILMLDEDEAGEAGREDIAARLSRFCFVKAHVFPKSDMQPEDLSSEELDEIVGGAK